MTPEHCGSFTFWHAGDRIRRTWHVWAVVDECGQLDHIYLSQLLNTAQGPLTQHQCTTPLFYRAWRHASQTAVGVTWSAEADDVVIDLFDD
jgi:hypothetical protein